MSAINSLLRNTFFSIFTNLLNRFGNTLLFIFIIQATGVASGGVYNLGLAYFFIASRFAFWGLDQLLTREVARDKSNAQLFINNFLFARVVLALFTVALLSAFVTLLNYPPQTKLVIYIMLLGVLPENINNLCWGVYAAFEEYYFSSISTVINLTAKLGIGAFLVWQGAPLTAIAFALLSGHVIAMIVNLVFVRRRYITGWEKPNMPFLLEQMPVALPFLFIGMFFILDSRVDTILLSLLSTEEAIGIYGAALALITAMAVIPEGYRTAILPVMARYASEDNTKLGQLYYNSYRLMLLLGVPIAVGLFLIAEELTAFVYRRDLPEAVTALRIMSVGVAFLFLSPLNNRLLIVYNRQGLTARILGIMTVLNIVLNILLIPQWGALGAAFGRTASITTMFILSTFAVRQIAGKQPLQSIVWRTLACSGVMGIIVWQLAAYGMWIQIGAGVIVYLVGVLLVRLVSRDELRLARTSLQQIMRRSTGS
jgi:O-antigen/teichoic acid export membrane protein